MENINSVSVQIGYSFQNQELLERALTHSSYANEHNCKNNERLEFLGDSILSLVVSERLFKLYENVDEGVLSKMRASLVCEQSLELMAEKISLGSIVKLGKGEERTGGRTRASVLSDAFEAVIAAIYLDSGIDSAREWILNIMGEEIKKAGLDKYYGDFKTQLQELLQKDGKPRAIYVVAEESGKDHAKKFVVAAVLEGNEIARGEGTSKKEAEQKAARNAILNLYHEAL